MTALLWLGLMGCPATMTDAPAPPTVEGARYQTDLEALAGIRSPGTQGWQAAQDLCATRLAALGFDVSLQDYGTGINVIGRKPGSSSTGTTVLSAHYDGVPNCPAADDNATGVAGVLEVARVLAPLNFRNDLVVACWDEEERGLLGSRAWAATLDGEPIDMVWSLEMIGFSSTEPDSQTLPFGLDLVFPDSIAQIANNGFRGDFITFVGNDRTGVAEAAFVAEADRIQLPVVSLILDASQATNPLFGDLQRSDHASFWGRDLPAAMITDTANFRNTAYHCEQGRDTLHRLDQGFATQVLQSVLASTITLLGPDG